MHVLEVTQFVTAPKLAARSFALSASVYGGGVVSVVVKLSRTAAGVANCACSVRCVSR
jgi:hypothetical protein